ncbi:MAG: HNH endonuclease [Nanoarchaeota archaeon]
MRFHKGSLNPNWKGGICKSKGYIYIKKPEHPYCNINGYIQEHRLIIEQYLCRYLNKDEHIHHINGIKTDNRIENLQIINNSNHIKLHHSEKEYGLMKNFKNVNWKGGIYINNQKEYHKKYSKKWGEINKDKINKQKRRYRKKNIKKLREYWRNYYFGYDAC